jgi:DNA repair protein RAD5
LFQAIDRVHRIGQVKNVIVKRFIIKDSVEENILKIQNKKIALVGGCALNEDAKAQRLEDLKILFE